MRVLALRDSAGPGLTSSQPTGGGVARLHRDARARAGGVDPRFKTKAAPEVGISGSGLDQQVRQRTGSKTDEVVCGKLVEILGLSRHEVLWEEQVVRGASIARAPRAICHPKPYCSRSVSGGRRAFRTRRCGVRAQVGFAG